MLDTLLEILEVFAYSTVILIAVAVAINNEVFTTVVIAIVVTNLIIGVVTVICDIIWQIKG